MICKICNKQFKNFNSLAQHITKKHKWLRKEYYDIYLKKENEGICPICKKETNFMNIGEGYRETCGNKHSGILKRQRLKENKEKNDQFIKKVSKNQKEIWRKREKDGTKDEIIKKIGKTYRKQIAELTKEEKIEKYGYLNKLLDEERKIIIKKMVYPLKKWYKNASEEDKEKKIDNMRKTMLGDRYYEDIMKSFLSYKERIRYITEKIYRKHKTKINPNNYKRKRGKEGYQLDHKFSIVAGFENNIKPEIISSIHNLQMLESIENNKKNSKCSISKKELLRLYEKGVS